MRMTISAAARLYGIHRSTLHRHIKEGRLSCVFEPDGGRALDLSELIRCYGEPPNRPEDVRQVATPGATPSATGGATPDATPPVAGSQALPADLLAQMLEVMRQQSETLNAQREELAALRREVSELRALPAPQPDKADAPDAQESPGEPASQKPSKAPPDQPDRPPARSFADLLERLNTRGGS